MATTCGIPHPTKKVLPSSRSRAPWAIMNSVSVNSIVRDIPSLLSTATRSGVHYRVLRRAFLGEGARICSAPPAPPGRPPPSPPLPPPGRPPWRGRRQPEDPGRCGGFREAACGARLLVRRAERQRAGEGRERLITEPPGIQRSVPEEVVHREGRCAPAGEAPGGGVPGVVR